MNNTPGLPWWLRVVDKWRVMEEPSDMRVYIQGRFVIMYETECYKCNSLLGTEYAFVKTLALPNLLSSADHGYKMLSPVDWKEGLKIWISYPGVGDIQSLFELTSKRFIRSNSANNEYYLLFKRVSNESSVMIYKDSRRVLDVTECVLPCNEQGVGGVNL